MVSGKILKGLSNCWSLKDRWLVLGGWGGWEEERAGGGAGGRGSQNFLETSEELKEGNAEGFGKHFFSSFLSFFFLFFPSVEENVYTLDKWLEIYPNGEKGLDVYVQVYIYMRK